MPYCGSTTLVKWGHNERTATALRCRSWNCDECAPQRKKLLQKDCHNGAPNTFLTLTNRRVSGRTANQAALILSRSWRLLRLRIMRKYNLKKLPFIAVIEAHQSGWPHLHILLRSIWIDAKWLSECMSDISDSPVLKILRIDNRAQINAYVAKYAGKAAHKFGTAKRYWQSKDWSLRPAEPEKPRLLAGSGFERESTTIQKVVENWRTFGWRVAWLSHWRAHALTGPPEAGP